MWVLILACAARDPAASGADDSDSAAPDTGNSLPDSNESVSQHTGDTGDSEAGETGETGETGTPPPPLPCGTFMGASSLGGLGFEGGMSSAVTADGARYAIVYFQDGDLTFDAGGPNEITLTPTGTVDAALARYDASGNLDWVRHVASVETATVEAVAPTSDGGAAVVGNYYGGVHIAYGQSDQLAMANDGEADAYVARFTSDGALVWAHVLRGDDDEIATDVAVLTDDTVVVGGLHRGDTMVSDEGPDEELLEFPVGASEAGFVVAYDGDGALLWVQRQLSTDYGRVHAIAIDPFTDEIVVGGMFTEETTFGSGQPDELTLVSDTYTGFVARYHTSGTFLGIAQLDHASVNDLKIAPDGQALAAGDFYEEAVLGAGEKHETHLATTAYSDAFVARFDATGALDWAGQSVSLERRTAVVRALASDGAGGMVVVGDFTEAVTLASASATEVSFESAGTYDVFAARYDATGALVCAIQIGGAKPDVGVGVTPLAGNTYEVIDQFAGATTVDAGEPTEMTVTSAGRTDVLYANYAF